MKQKRLQHVFAGVTCTFEVRWCRSIPIWVLLIGLLLLLIVEKVGLQLVQALEHVAGGHVNCMSSEHCLGYVRQVCGLHGALVAGYIY